MTQSPSRNARKQVTEIGVYDAPSINQASEHLANSPTRQRGSTSPFRNAKQAALDAAEEPASAFTVKRL